MRYNWEKLGQFRVPGVVSIFPGHVEKRDCPGKSGTDGHLEYRLSRKGRVKVLALWLLTLKFLR